MSKRTCDRCGDTFMVTYCGGLGGYKQLCSKCSSFLKEQQRREEKQKKEIEQLNKELKEAKSSSNIFNSESSYSSSDSSSGSYSGSSSRGIDIPIGKLLWIFVLWWAYILYFMFVWPVKQLIIGIKEKDYKKIVIGGVILGFYAIALIVSSIQDAIAIRKLHFTGLDNPQVVYGEKYNYLDGVELFKNKEKIDQPIKYTGVVDSSKIGQYEVVYEATYNGETVIKKVLVSVVPYYYNERYKITVLERFKIIKTSTNTYEISGTITNDSYRTYRTFKLELYNEELEQAITIDFTDGLQKGENHFIVIITHDAEPLNEYKFFIRSIKTY